MLDSENLTKTLCYICDSPMILADSGDKICPVCEKNKKRDGQTGGSHFLSDPSGFDDSDV